jgi:hypothetical protein
MNIKLFIFRLVMMLFLPSLSGCALGSPEDLRLEKLSLVRIEPETKKEIDYGRYNDNDGLFYRMKLEFSTNADLVGFSENYYLTSRSYFCAIPDHKVLMSGSQLYWEGADVRSLGMARRYGMEEIPEENIPREPDHKIIRSLNQIEAQRDPENKDNSVRGSERNVYAIYLMLYSPRIESWRNDSNDAHQPEYEAYDLVVHSEDVCIDIEGRVKLGRGFKLNTLRVEKEMIKMVLEGLEPSISDIEN